MNDEAGGGGVLAAPPSLSELRALRSDWEDVPVPELGGRLLRVFALSGTARARLVPDIARLAATSNGEVKDPSVIADILAWQTRVVASSLGYPEAEWDAFGGVIGSGAIERLYEVAAKLSALDADAQAEATRRLRRRRNAASGID